VDLTSSSDREVNELDDCSGEDAILFVSLAFDPAIDFLSVCEVEAVSFNEAVKAGVETIFDFAIPLALAATPFSLLPGNVQEECAALSDLLSFVADVVLLISDKGLLHAETTGFDAKERELVAAELAGLVEVELETDEDELSFCDFSMPFIVG